MRPDVVLMTIFVVFLVAFLVYWFLLMRLWMRAVLGGAPVPILRLLGMRLRKANVANIVDACIVARKAGITVSVDELEMHSLAGGNAPRVIAGMAAAAEAGIPLSYMKACAIDLAGRDVIEEVRACQTPRTLFCPDAFDPDKTFDAVSADGVALKAKAVVTVRPRLVLGFGVSLSGVDAEVVGLVKDVVAAAGRERMPEAAEAIAQALSQAPVKQEARRTTLAEESGVSDTLIVERIANAIRNVLADADGRSALDAPEEIAKTVREMRVDQETALEVLDIEVTIEEADGAWQS